MDPPSQLLWWCIVLWTRHPMHWGSSWAVSTQNQCHLQRSIAHNYKIPLPRRTPTIPTKHVLSNDSFFKLLFLPGQHSIRIDEWEAYDLYVTFIVALVLLTLELWEQPVEKKKSLLNTTERIIWHPLVWLTLPLIGAPEKSRTVKIYSEPFLIRALYILFKLWIN